MTTLLRNRKSMGFQLTELHTKKDPHAFHYLSQRMSFWIASMTVFTFVVGNMMGQHGWHAFWKSVIGKSDDSLIVYTGTVSPITSVPDYRLWARYGGNPHEHTYRQVPKDVLVKIPKYDSRTSHTSVVFSVGHMGSYSTGVDGSGSHPGVDIRAPIGTPVRAMANGIVDEVKSGGGFGKVIVVRHPNIPDPSNPRRTTTLYSAYAHLSAMYVTVGSVVQKAELIGLSGDTGFVSGPHLHFQIDREDSPWHPYWPFSSNEAVQHNMDITQAVNTGLNQERGLRYTVNPMLYVQANYDPISKSQILAQENTLSAYEQRRESRLARIADLEETLRTSAVAQTTIVARLQSRRDARIRDRLARNSTTQIVAVSSTSPAPVVEETIVVSRETVVTLSDSYGYVSVGEISSVDFRHDGAFSASQDAERVRVSLLDANGEVLLQPEFEGELTIVTAYGEAEFRPLVLSPNDFKQGIAEIFVLPKGRRTIVIKLVPFDSLSKPLRYERSN